MNIQKKILLKACNTFRTLALLFCKCGVVVELVTTLACHAGGRGFKSLPSRHFVLIPFYTFIISLHIFHLNIFALTVEHPEKKGSPTESIDKSIQKVKIIARDDEFYSPVVQQSKDKFNFNKSNPRSKINTHFRGPDFEIIQNVFETIDVEYELQLVPPRNIEILLKSGEADIGLGMKRNKETLLYADFPRIPMRTREYFFYGRAQEVQENRMTFEKVLEHNYTIGILTSVNYPRQFWELFPFDDNLLNSHLLEIKDYEESIRLLKQRKIDLFLGDKDKTNPVIRDLGADDIIFQYRNILYWYDFYCGISKKSKIKDLDELKRKIQRSLYKMQESGKLKEINEHWINNKT